MGVGNLLVRADGSAAIGSGHVMRCLALAQAWQHAGGEATFAMAETTEALNRRLGEERCRIERIRGVPGSSEDCASMQELVKVQQPSWIVLDGYPFDCEYRQSLQDIGCPCLIVDDNGGSEYYGSELVLNQNLHASETMYQQRPGHTRLLLGPRFSMLRDEFTAYRNWLRPIPESAKRVLVTMGGSDPRNVTPRIVSSLARMRVRELELRVVVGGGSENGREVEEIGRQFPDRVQVFRDSWRMAELMVWAELAIAGAGTTCWELCLLQLPAALIVAAENLEPIAWGLAAAGAALNAGRAEEIDYPALADEIENLLMSGERRGGMSQAGCELVDGWGRERVLEAMGVGDKVCG